MLDFTSALYLGLRHASTSLRPWAQLTAGVPAALAEPRVSLTVADRLARLTRTEAGALSRSTLHAFWDVVPLLADGRRDDITIHIDSGTYAVARWGVERAACRGIAVSTFAHHDPSELEHRVREHARRQLRPLVVADGLCPSCGGQAPVAAYSEIATRFGGLLVLDDTQALGILGPQGAGSLRPGPSHAANVVLVASLAKGFGAPLAFVGGSSEHLASFRAGGETFVHTSPPTFADLHAAMRALDLNETQGDQRRARLRGLVRRFQSGLRRLGFGPVVSRPFPVQPLRPVPAIEATELHRRLRRQGVRAVLQHGCCEDDVRVSFLITAMHTRGQIDFALKALSQALTLKPLEAIHQEA